PDGAIPEARPAILIPGIKKAGHKAPPFPSRLIQCPHEIRVFRLVPDAPGSPEQWLGSPQWFQSRSARRTGSNARWLALLVLLLQLGLQSSVRPATSPLRYPTGSSPPTTSPHGGLLRYRARYRPL